MSEHQLNVSGLICPDPLMLLRKKIREMTSGEIVRVIATDPSTVRDIPKFCTFLSHELLEKKQDDEMFIYRIRKG